MPSGQLTRQRGGPGERDPPLRTTSPDLRRCRAKRIDMRAGSLTVGQSGVLWGAKEENGRRGVEQGRWRTMFLGTHTPRLDEKGRLFLPAKYRERMAPGLVVTRGQERSLFLYPM